MTPEQIAALSPEERAEYEALLAEIGDTRAREGLAPPPGGSDDVVRLDEPIVVESGTRPGADLAPDRPAPAPRRTLPPLPAPPERGPGSSGISRPRSRMLKVGSALGALFGDGDLPDFYGEERDRADTLADSRYRAGMARYQAELAGRGQRQKELQGQRPLPEPVRQRLGLPDDAQYSDVQALSQLGWGSLRRQEEGADQARELENLRQKGRLTLQEQRRLATLEAIQERARLRGKKGGGSGTGADSTGVRAAIEQSGLQDMVEAYTEGDPGAAQELPFALVDAMGGDRLMATSMMTSLRQERNKKLTDRKSREDQFRKEAVTMSSAKAGLKDIRGHLAEDDVNLPSMLQEIQKEGVTGQVSEPTATLQNKLTALASSYIASKGGKAITDSERRLIAGRLSSILDPSILSDSSSLTSFITQSLSRGIQRQIARPSDIREFMAMVDRGLSAQANAVATGPEGAKNLSSAGFKKEARQRVLDAFAIENPGEPTPIGVRPTESPTVWELGMPDGSVRDYRIK